MKFPKTATLLIGFLTSMMGTVGSFVLVESLNQAIKDLNASKAGQVQQIETISNLTQQYFLANQQGDLIFALAQDRSARADITQLLYKSNVLDRATPVRNLIGALALTRKVDYRSTYDEYEKLNDQARASGSLTDYQTLKAWEKGLVEGCSAYVAALHQSVAAINPKIARAEDDLRVRQASLLALSSLGAAILLLANVLEELQVSRDKHKIRSDSGKGSVTVKAATPESSAPSVVALPGGEVPAKPQQ